MAKPHGSVRIGPISLFALIIILCLAVLAVLSVSTARAEYAITERQVTATAEVYALEDAGQSLMAKIDGALSQVRESGSPAQEAADEAVTGALGLVEPDGGDADADADAGSAEEAIADDESETTSEVALEQYGKNDISGVTCCARLENGVIKATLSQESGRTLAIVVRVNADATYTIEQWKTTTEWVDNGANESLWQG